MDGSGNRGEWRGVRRVVWKRKRREEGKGRGGKTNRRE